MIPVDRKKNESGRWQGCVGVGRTGSSRLQVVEKTWEFVVFSGFASTQTNIFDLHIYRFSSVTE
jgi:hypothetical protein